MAPLKFEEKMKDTLEQRAMQPSASSWDRLSAQLDGKQAQKKEGKRIWWYGIAAIFIGVLILTSIFSNTGSTSKNIDTQLVDRSNDNQVKRDDKTNFVKENKTEQPKRVEVAVENVDDINRSTQPTENKEDISNNTNEGYTAQIAKSETFDSDNKARSKEADNLILVENTNKNAVSSTEKEKMPLLNTKTINDKVDDVVAQIAELQKNDVQVTDEEINTLLLKAQREITSKKIIKSNAISASTLLQDVEEELDDTFKQRVFEALKRGFQKVRTAVAEREN